MLGRGLPGKASTGHGSALLKDARPRLNDVVPCRRRFATIVLQPALRPRIAPTHVLRLRRAVYVCIVHWPLCLLRRFAADDQPAVVDTDDAVHRARDIDHAVSICLACHLATQGDHAAACFHVDFHARHVCCAG